MSLHAQLSFEIPEAQPQPATKSEPDIIGAILDYHHGDARAALEDLLADADFLRGQLFAAQRLISQGRGREFRPKYERV
jgi:hypothetical protein